MEKRIILVTGGRRSGKSEWAEKLALEASDRPLYLATSRVLDDETRERVAVHSRRRGDRWDLIEEPLYLSHHNMTGRVCLIDCVTMWAMNAVMDLGDNSGDALALLEKEFDGFTANDATYIFVTNETGLGGIAADAFTRRFTDLQGSINSYIASRADEVYFSISGIPVKIK